MAAFFRADLSTRRTADAHPRHRASERHSCRAEARNQTHASEQAASLRGAGGSGGLRCVVAKNHRAGQQLFGGLRRAVQDFSRGVEGVFQCPFARRTAGGAASLRGRNRSRLDPLISQSKSRGHFLRTTCGVPNIDRVTPEFFWRSRGKIRRTRPGTFARRHRAGGFRLCVPE